MSIYGGKIKYCYDEISLADRVENTLGEGEYVGHINKHFLLFPQCFPKPFSIGSLKVGIVWYKV